MKKRYSLIAFLMFAMASLTSCDDFLDCPPYDNIDDTEYWQNETHIRTYSYGFYASFFNGYGTTKLIGGSSYGYGDSFNDDIGGTTQSEFTPIRVPDSDSGWDFGVIRKANYMLEKVYTVPGLDSEALNHWVGVSRFFRGVAYANLVFGYGDVPFYNHRLDVSEREELYKDRDPRTMVVDSIMNDFKYALENVRTDDGNLTINRYVVAAMVSRLMLREGTFLKYHNKGIDANGVDIASKAIALSRDAALVVMNSGKYAISEKYNALFSSEDLSGNSEVIFYRQYLTGVLEHCVLTYNNAEGQAGGNKSLLDSYLMKDGKPIALNATWDGKSATGYFKNRDPRINETFREKYYLLGEDNSPFNYSRTGFSMRKFMDDSKATSTDLVYRQQNNVTDCPLLRYAEVLLNYAEARYELGELTQADLDKSINVVRARKGVEMPALEMVGESPAVNGEVYDDPKRLELNPEGDVSSLLWEIRRERRVEMCFEGVRYSDLKRWKKLDYMYNGTNPDIRLGAYIKYADYPKVDTKEVTIYGGGTEGYYLSNTGAQRQAPQDKNYVKPVPKDQIQLYKDNGYTLSQTPEWVEEENGTEE